MDNLGFGKDISFYPIIEMPQMDLASFVTGEGVNVKGVVMGLDDLTKALGIERNPDTVEVIKHSLAMVRAVCRHKGYEFIGPTFSWNSEDMFLKEAELLGGMGFTGSLTVFPQHSYILRDSFDIDRPQNGDKDLPSVENIGSGSFFESLKMETSHLDQLDSAWAEKLLTDQEQASLGAGYHIDAFGRYWDEPSYALARRILGKHVNDGVPGDSPSRDTPHSGIAAEGVRTGVAASRQSSVVGRQSSVDSSQKEQAAVSNVTGTGDRSSVIGGREVVSKVHILNDHRSPITDNRALTSSSSSLKMSQATSDGSIKLDVDVFSRLHSAVNGLDGFKTKMSALRGSCQRLYDATKIRLCIPVDAFRNAPDFVEALSKTGALKNLLEKDKNIEFELVITGVKEADAPLLAGINGEIIKKKLGLPANFTISVLSEEEMLKAAGSYDKAYDPKKAEDRIALTKDFFTGTAGDKEYTFVAEGVSTENEASELAAKLSAGDMATECARENVAVRLLVRPVPGESMYSLSAIINDCLNTFRHSSGEKSFSIAKILPVPAPMTNELTAVLAEAWFALISA
ncbi:MAG: hypothetical protein HQL28_05865 [Candidatus Omnitrophica bacterium]|nr:hypothetical protein [Candidatus Omnitrophota bacterium]